MENGLGVELVRYLINLIQKYSKLLVRRSKFRNYYTQISDHNVESY